MTTIAHEPEQLELPLPAAPATTPILAVVEARLSAITTRALPRAQARLAFLESVWVTEDPEARPVFVDGEPPVLCHPAGAERLSSAAADASALTAEAHALADLHAAIEIYDAGGALVAGEMGIRADALPTDRRPARPRAPQTVVSDLQTRTEFVRRLRGYAEQVARERHAAVTAGNLAMATELKAELAALRVRLCEVTSVIRRRPRKVEAADRGRTGTRRIA